MSTLPVVMIFRTAAFAQVAKSPHDAAGLVDYGEACEELNTFLTERGYIPTPDWEHREGRRMITTAGEQYLFAVGEYLSKGSFVQATRAMGRFKNLDMEDCAWGRGPCHLEEDISSRYIRAYVQVRSALEPSVAEDTRALVTKWFGDEADWKSLLDEPLHASADTGVGVTSASTTSRGSRRPETMRCSVLCVLAECRKRMKPGAAGTRRQDSKRGKGNETSQRCWRGGVRKWRPTAKAHPSV